MSVIIFRKPMSYYALYIPVIVLYSALHNYTGITAILLNYFNYIENQFMLFVKTGSHAIWGFEQAPSNLRRHIRELREEPNKIS